MISWNLIIRNCSKSYRWFHMTFISQSHALKNISFEVLSKYLDVNKVSHFQLLRLHFFKKMHVGFHNSICGVFPSKRNPSWRERENFVRLIFTKTLLFSKADNLSTDFSRKSTISRRIFKNVKKSTVFLKKLSCTKRILFLTTF